MKRFKRTGRRPKSRMQRRILKALKEAHKTVAPLVEEMRRGSKGISAEVAAMRF